MQTDKIREAQRAEPFRPFILHTTNGRSFLVDHPEFVAPMRRVVVYEHPIHGFRILDAMLVSELEYVEDASPGADGDSGD